MLQFCTTGQKCVEKCSDYVALRGSDAAASQLYLFFSRVVEENRSSPNLDHAVRSAVLVV